MLVTSYGAGTAAFPAANTYTFALAELGIGPFDYFSIQAFLQFGTAGGTSIDAFLQTTFDDGLTWQDVANLQVLAANVKRVAAVNKYIAAAAGLVASDGALAVNTVVNGLFGIKWRVKLVVVGAYHIDNIYRLHVDAQKVR